MLLFANYSVFLRKKQNDRFYHLLWLYRDLCVCHKWHKIGFCETIWLVWRLCGGCRDRCRRRYDSWYFIECGAFLDGTSLLFDCLGLGFVVRYRFPKIRDPFEQYIFYIRCYRIGVVCGGRYRQDLGFRVSHVGGDRDGNYNRLVWRYDEGYID